MKNDFGAVYWSISPNDEAMYCQCDSCARVDKAEGGPQGSLIHFVNKIAAMFPGRQITTLAYSYYAKAPRKTRPGPNVTILLSSIDADRNLPLSTAPGASGFRRNLDAWRKLTNRVFVWDYCTQFTNYLTPFPVAATFANSFRYLQKKGVTGIFEQGSGDTYSDMSELKAYLIAAFLWNPGADYEQLVSRFLHAYYGKAASVVSEYLLLMDQQVREKKTRLDIYGNPVNHHKDYLSPANIDSYSRLMDRAEALVETDPASLRHIQLLRTGHDYVYLQQAKFFGKDLHGVFEKDIAGGYQLKAGLPKKVAHFVATAATAGVKILSEEGPDLRQYSNEWKTIFNTPYRHNMAADGQLALHYPFIQDYPAKNERTLMDETPGYADYSYNWLCFDKVPMDAVIDMDAARSVRTISIRFLEDARHWFFRPSAITIETSEDGVAYFMAGDTDLSLPAENWSIQAPVYKYPVNKKVRFVRVKAFPQKTLPAWRAHPSKNPLIACDEIWIE